MVVPVRARPGALKSIQNTSLQQALVFTATLICNGAYLLLGKANSITNAKEYA